MTDEQNTEQTTTEDQTNSTENHEGSQQPEQFSAEYVGQLRDEAAQRRVEAREATEARDTYRDALRRYAVAAAVSDILADPEDIGEYSDEWDDDDGMPDAEKISEAAQELVSRKPHFGRPSGDIGQGFRDESSEGVDLAALMRAGA